MRRSSPAPTLSPSTTALAVFLALAAPPAFAHGPQTSDSAAVETTSHRFDEVAPGVYFATGTGKVFVQSNALVIVNESDVVVVDSHVTPAAARALLTSIGELTDKPIRFLINTHYHFDHAHGNQAFPEGVSIIGHEFTRHKLSGDVLKEPTYVAFTANLPAVIAGMKENARQETDAAKRAALEGEIAVQEAHLVALGEVRPTPPDVTLERKLTLHRGERTIELHFLGRGHTGGDVVVYLPQEKVVFTGDLLLPFPSYMGDGHVDEWSDTLEKLKQLDFETVLPGHGPPFQDRKLIDAFQNLLRSLWDQVVDLRRQGLSPEQAVDKLDLSKEESPYPVVPLRDQVAPQVARLVQLRHVSRIYELLDRREGR